MCSCENEVCGVAGINCAVLYNALYWDILRNNCYLTLRKYEKLEKVRKPTKSHR